MTIKAWYQSRGMWGALIAGISGVVGTVGFAVSTEDQTFLVDSAEHLADLILALGSLIGGLLAWVGRKRAQGPIRPTKSGPYVGVVLLAGALAVVMLSSCSMPSKQDVEVAQSIRKEVRLLLAVQDTVDVAEQTASDMLRAGHIDRDTGLAIYEAADVVRPILEAAWRAVGEGRPERDIVTLLQQADAALTVLEQFLAAKQKPVPGARALLQGE